MHLKSVLFYCRLFASTLLKRVQAQIKQAPVNLIFDTDFGPDYDDVGDMAVMYALAYNGECNILATMASQFYSAKHQRTYSILQRQRGARH